MKNFKRMSFRIAARMTARVRRGPTPEARAPVPAFVPYGYFSLSGSRELNIILHSMLVINRENQNPTTLGGASSEGNRKPDPPSAHYSALSAVW